MTATRPERDSGAPYEQSYEHSSAYGDAGAFEAAVDRMDDPLNDPLPGRHPSPWFRSGGPDDAAEHAPGPAQHAPDERPAPPTSQPSQVNHPSQVNQPSHGLPQDPAQQRWYAEPDPISQAADHRPAVDAPAYESMYGQPGPEQQTYAPHPHPEGPDPYDPYDPDPYDPEPYDPEPYDSDARDPYGTSPASPPVDDETVGLRTADTRRLAEPAAAEASTADQPTGGRAERRAAARRAGGETDDEERPAEGRAARRKAAQTAARRGGHRRRQANPATTTAATKADGAPLTRLEARRAERAKKPSPAVVASRAVGELFISVGVLMLLFVTYQLWWTNVRAGQEAGSAANKIHEDWANGKRKPGAFEPGQGFAIMHIPRLDVVVPVAEGIDKERVLDRGMVGHYAEGALKTAMPGDKKGNFAVAGHRNTHGEPFRYVNQLEKGDQIVVETQDKYYVYAMQSILPQTSPGNTGVIAPVPKGSGFTGPGRYITLTTCTPEFTSTYRMIVWGKMVDERPRSKGKPDALVR